TLAGGHLHQFSCRLPLSASYTNHRRGARPPLDYALPNEPLGKLRDDAGGQQIRLCRLENRNGLLDVGREQPSQSLAGLLAVKRNERSADLLLVLQEPVEVRLHGTGVVKESVDRQESPLHVVRPQLTHGLLESDRIDGAGLAVPEERQTVGCKQPQRSD